MWLEKVGWRPINLNSTELNRKEKRTRTEYQDGIDTFTIESTELNGGRDHFTMKTTGIERNR